MLMEEDRWQGCPEGDVFVAYLSDNWNVIKCPILTEYPGRINFGSERTLHLQNSRIRETPPRKTTPPEHQ